MNNRRARSLVVALLATGLLNLQVPFGAAAPADSTSAEAVRSVSDTARDFLYAVGGYDSAIGLLEKELQDPALSLIELQRAHLLLILAYVLASNECRLEKPATSDLYFKAARAHVHDCLATPGLSHTQPIEKEMGIPPGERMNELFASVRKEYMGTLIVPPVHPSDALVLLDKDTLSVDGCPDSCTAHDLFKGLHKLSVQARNYKTRDVDVYILPGSEIRPTLSLDKKHRPLWYVSRWVGASVGTGVIAWLAFRKQTITDPPLEPPPDPPSAH